MTREHNGPLVARYVRGELVAEWEVLAACRYFAVVAFKPLKRRLARIKRRSARRRSEAP